MTKTILEISPSKLVNLLTDKPVSLSRPAPIMSPPPLVSPADGAVGQLRPVTMSWLAVPKALYYRIQVATDVNFNNIVWDEILPGTSAGVSTLAYSTIHYWRVASIGLIGVSAFSGVRSFTTGIVQDPPLVNLVARFEPNHWGYADGTVITVGNPFKAENDATKNLSSVIQGAPTFKTGILNGKSVVRFNGATDGVSGAWTDGLQSHTIAIVVIPRGASGATHHVVCYDDALASSSGVIYEESTGHWNLYERTGIDNIASDGLFAVGTADLLVITGQSNTTCRLRRNGVEVASVVVGVLWNGGTHFSVGFVNAGGGTTRAQVDIAACLVYNTPLTGQSLLDLENYLTVNYLTP